MIPKKLWTYWYGDRGPSWLRLQTIETFQRHHPDWEVHTLRERPDDASSPYCDFSKSVLPDTRCDVVRWCVLAEHGGVFSDLDVLYLRPIPWDPKTLATTCDGGTPETLGRGRSFAIGLVLAPAGDPLAAKLAQKALVRARAWKEGADHQHCGSRLLAEEGKWAENSTGLRIQNLPATTLYPQGFYRHDNEKLWVDRIPIDLDPVVGLHWGGGHAAARLAESVVDESWARRSGCAVARAWRKGMGTS